MKVKILSLYADLMNLYGSNGNVKCLKRHFESVQVEAEIIEKSIDDEIDFSDIDLVIMGAGTERSRDRVLEDMKRYFQEFKAYIEEGNMCLICGNAFELFGKCIKNLDGTETECFGLFDFESYENARRTVVDTICTANFLPKEIIGFMNKQTYTSFVSTPLFRVKKGVGNAPDRNDEGIIYKEFYATELSGPILIRNPHFRRYLEEKIYKKKGYDIIPREFENELNAYTHSLEGLNK